MPAQIVNIAIWVRSGLKLPRFYSLFLLIPIYVIEMVEMRRMMGTGRDLQQSLRSGWSLANGERWEIPSFEGPPRPASRGIPSATISLSGGVVSGYL